MAILTVRRALLIVNPASRIGERSHGAVLRACAGAGVDVTVRSTEGPGDAGRFAAAHGARYDAVFALGGDGTLAEVAGALAGTGVAVGILPAGTGNLAARALGIPLAPAAALHALARGQRRQIDVARMDDGRCTIFAAGAGIDAAMIAGATSARKRRYGVLTYFVTGTKAAFQRQRFLVRATVDGVPISCDASAVFVANFGSVLGGLIHLGPDIHANDGALDLCVLSPQSLLGAFGVAWRMLRNDFRPHRDMQFMKGRVIELTTVPIRPLQSDGEAVGQTPARFQVEAGALTLLVPSR
ncbi:MAG: diacylglycerol kinase family protein [Gemmatimonadaceae bacterium]